MRSYRGYVAGEDEDGRGWVYTPRAAALIADPLRVGRAVSRRERGTGDPSEDGFLAGRVATCGDEQIARALSSARAAQPGWAKVPLEQRLSFVVAVHDELRRRAAELHAVLVDEGHPARLADWEVSSILACCHPESVAVASELGSREYTIDGHRIRLRYRPDGVVCLSPPQNAAAANSLHGVWALAGGNAVVIGAPRSSCLGVMFAYREIVAPLLRRAGAPPGALSVLCESTASMLAAWLASSDVDDIYYFGGSSRGLALGQECFARGKKPILELSGNDGVLVWRGADVPGAARALMEAFFGSGQICMVPRFAVVHPSVADELADVLTAMVQQLRPGLPDDPEVILSPGFRGPLFRAAIAESVAAGGKVLLGGGATDHRGKTNDSGMFLQPTVIRVDGLEMARTIESIMEETFFPLLHLIVADGGGEDPLGAAIAFLNANPYGLRNSLWSPDPAVADRFVDELRGGGIVKINESHVGIVAVLPTHGGTGLSGGPFGGAAIPLLRTCRLQAVCEPMGRSSAGIGVAPGAGHAKDRV
jgi:acyl-CoA reductase-like NAD-dependent aldehyde dehydrogenase